MKNLSTTTRIISLLSLTAILTSRAPADAPPPADPFRVQQPAAAAPPPVPNDDPKNVSIVFESFSVGIEDAATLLRERPDDTILYGEIVGQISKKKTKQESLTVLRVRSSQKATTESISEQIYPTEMGPPTVPTTLTLNSQPQPATPPSSEPNSPNASFGIVTPGAPSAFETRNTGFTMEVEPNLGPDERSVDLRLIPEFVTASGRSAWGQGAARAEMPEFETQRINSAYTLRVGKPFLIGTMSRPPVSKIDPESANRVWFAFVTATVAAP